MFSKYFGLLCTSQGPIELDVAYDIVDGAVPLIPKKIANADLTVDLLNIELAIRDSREQCLGVLADFLSGSAGKENDGGMKDTFADLHLMIPVAFAHNVSAKAHPSAKNDTSELYSFVVSADGMIYQIGREAKCEVFAIVKDELRELNEQLQQERDTLEKLTGHGPDKSLGSINESLSFEELAEISALSEEFESAEDFPMIVEDQFGTTEEVARSKPSDECAQVEKRIRDLLKRLALARNEFPHLWWESGSVDSVYADPEYPKFAMFYSRLLNLKTPMITRSPAVLMRAATTGKKPKEDRRSQSTRKSSASVTRGPPIKLRRTGQVQEEAAASGSREVSQV
ncbi:hypothetical protein AAVH_05647 [Aphelenchoides avenae]|nr:hypothetical protein AAVH_05647 [Aphelenchus avenae]